MSIVAPLTEESEMLLAENRRLRREARVLRERLASFESSRWWRLHPRRFVRRRSSRTHDDGPDLATAADAPAPPDDVTARFREEVLPLLTVSRDTFTEQLGELDIVVSTFGGRAARVLEIGSYQGMSACYFLWRLPDASVTCVDSFAGRPSYPADLEQTFDENVARIDAGRVTKIVRDSRAALLELQGSEARFDIVYVDGSHLALDVLVDAALSWRLVANEGVIVFDDYSWNHRGEDPLLRPGPAIDAFLQLIAGRYDLLASGAQLIVRKSAESA